MYLNYHSVFFNFLFHTDKMKILYLNQHKSQGFQTKQKSTEFELNVFLIILVGVHFFFSLQKSTSFGQVRHFFVASSNFGFPYLLYPLVFHTEHWISFSLYHQNRQIYIYYVFFLVRLDNSV